MKHASKDNNNVCVHSVHLDSFRVIFQCMLHVNHDPCVSLDISIAVPIHGTFFLAVIYAELPAGQLNSAIFAEINSKIYFFWIRSQRKS